MVVTMVHNVIYRWFFFLVKCVCEEERNRSELLTTILVRTHLHQCFFCHLVITFGEDMFSPNLFFVVLCVWQDKVNTGRE